jgi:hypothetical protein
MNKTLEELLNEMQHIGIFNGTFDAKHGSWEFMHGVAAVMEYLAYEISEDYGDEFQEKFWKNYRRSLDKAS